MQELFFLQLVISFFVGAIFIVSLTFIAERFGGFVGGIIGGLPSTILVSLLFIAYTSGVDLAANVALLVPLVVTFACIFLISYVLLVEKVGVICAITCSLFIWIACSSVFYFSKPIGLLPALIAFLVLVTVILVSLDKMHLPVSSGEKIVINSKQILVRSIISGGIVAGSVVAAKLGGATLGAIFSGFPALFLSTMIIAVMARGVDFSKSLTKSLCQSAIYSCTVYCLAVYLTYPSLGIVAGTLLSYSMSVVAASLLYFRKQSL